VTFTPTRGQCGSPPGGACGCWQRLISGKVFDETEGKIDRVFEALGEKQVRNLSRPVRIHVLADPTQSAYAPRPNPLPLPDKLSIAVLPFTTMSGDSEQD